MIASDEWPEVTARLLLMQDLMAARLREFYAATGSKHADDYCSALTGLQRTTEAEVDELGGLLLDAQCGRRVPA
jgi:hypothetical protein